MKKLIAILLAVLFCVTAFASCGKKTTDAPATDTPATETPATETPAEKTGVEKAKDYVKALYKDSAELTPSDYNVVGVVAIEEVQYTVEWTVDVTEGVTVVKNEDGTVTIDVNEKTPEAIAYVLTATVKDAAGATASVSFNHSVPAFKELSFAEYLAAAVNDPVVVKGVVTGIMAKSKGNSYNCLYLQDADGGYYVYGMATDPVTDDKVEVGMTVRVTGAKDLYSGTHEIKSASVEIISSEKTEVTPVDWTEKFTAAESLKDEALTREQSMLVTVKGVEITGQDTASGYYKFKLGSLESYIRISSSVCPLVKDDQTAFIQGHSEHLGWIANATGVICVYDGAFYLTPVSTDAFEYVSLPAKSDAEMVAFEKENLSVETTITEACEFALIEKGQSYEQVTITWTTDNEIVTLADGKMVFAVPENDVVVTLTAAITCGEATDTKEFSVKVQAPAEDMTEDEILEKAFALEDGKSLNGKQVLCGKISEIVTAYDATYGNITVNITVGDKTIQCYRLIGGEDLAVDDVITVTGILKNYKGTVEFDAKCTYVKGEAVEESKQAVVVEKAFALEDGKSLNGKQVLCGTITEIVTAYDATYGNITVNLAVGDKTIQCYRLIGGEDLAVGDVITVTGVIKNYKGTIEFDAKCTYIKGSAFAQAKQAIVIEKAFALEDGKSLNGKQVLCGQISEIVTPYDATYGNITVNITVGDKTIQCYRLIGGEDLAVGDSIKVTGVIKNYKGTIEFDAKCTYVKLAEIPA